MMFSQDALCLKESAGFCSFQIVLKADDALVERCEFCGKRIVYNIRHGEMDNRKYLAAHVRDTLQPFGKTGHQFEQVYGMDGVKEVIKARKEQAKAFQRTEDMNAEARDMLKTLKRRSFHAKWS